MPSSFISAAGRPIVEGQWPLATANNTYVSAMLQPTTLQSFVATCVRHATVKTQELMMEGEGCADHAARPVGHSRAVRAATLPPHAATHAVAFSSVGPTPPLDHPCVSLVGYIGTCIVLVLTLVSPCFLEISPTTSHTRFVVPFPSWQTEAQIVLPFQTIMSESSVVTVRSPEHLDELLKSYKIVVADCQCSPPSPASPTIPFAEDIELCQEREIDHSSS